MSPRISFRLHHCGTNPLTPFVCGTPGSPCHDGPLKITLTLRGAWNFQTPPGWDTVYTPVFNMLERPVAPMLVIRVETDWHVHDSEFRYILQPGETISASHSLPIGQVIFVPREEITFRTGTKEEIAARHQSALTFYQEKAKTKLRTPYGLEYSPHYQTTSRQKKATPKPSGAEAAAEPTA